MLLPTAYDYSTETATSTLSRFSLTPSGREIDAELSYGIGRARRQRMARRRICSYRRQPGHITDSKNDVGAAVRFSLSLLSQVRSRRLNRGVSIPTLAR